jgi:two-component system, sensor histidine kinase and response regulator
MEETPKVLFLDDEENILSSLRRLFIDDDLSVLTSASGPEALEMLKRNEVAVIVSDNIMPGMRGIEFLQEAKSISPNSVRIMLTGYAEIKAVMNAINKGEVYRFITKPWDDDELRNTINHSIDRYRITMLNEELREKKKELEHLNQQKSQLIGMVAHDLRNPLTVIMGLGDLLSLQLKDSLGEKQLAYLDRIKASSIYMVNLINNMLDVRMVESGKVNLDAQETDVLALVRECVDLNNFLAESKNIFIRFAHKGSGFNAQIDRLRIEQAMNNVLSNAAKYSEPGSTIWVDVARIASQVVISVKDEGPGIPQEDLDRIFEPFMKGSAKPTAGEKSTGLGLAIVKKVAEAHNGTIRVESQLGVGTTFHIALPMVH